jgi:AraC-like DNA-binding protein/quercetin dioxygenase-like cupin family protein
MDIVLTKTATRGFRLLFSEKRRQHLAYGRHSLALEAGAVCRFDLQPTNGRHRHNYFEACLVLDGQGVFTHGGKTFALAAGDVFLAEPGVEHEIASNETRDLELIYFSFDITTGRAPAGERREDRLLGAFLSSRRLWATGGTLCARYAAWLPTDADGALRALGPGRLLETLALEIIGMLVDPDSLPPADGATGESETVRRALDYINGHLQDRLAPAALAAAVGASPRQLRRLFRQHLGGTVVAEINRRKMNSAANYLLMRFPITEIAYRYGMEHPSQFTRAFKQAIGVSPREYQRRYTPLDRAPRTVRDERRRPRPRA